LEESLEEGENIAALMEKAVSGEVSRRKMQAEYARRGLLAIAKTQKAGDGIPAETVIAELEAKLDKARKAARKA
jgi:hypothetical protein